MNSEFICKSIIDCKDSPHIAMRLIFQFCKINNDVLKLALNNSEKDFEIVFNNLIDLGGQVKSLFDKRQEILNKIESSLHEIDKSLGERTNTLNYTDNSKEIHNIFSDFLGLSIRIINTLSVIYGKIIGKDIKGSLGLLKDLKSSDNNNIKEMIESDEKMWTKLLAELRSSSEHINDEFILKGYDILYEDGEELPLLKLPRFVYKNSQEINISDYLITTYINMITFIEDIIAIGINSKIKNSKLVLLKTIDDNGDLDSVENVYTLHFLSN